MTEATSATLEVVSPPTSLYRCEDCGEVVRFEAGRTSLKHLCQAFDADGKYLGKDAESRYIEFPDDGRDVENDLRGGTWYAEAHD